MFFRYNKIMNINQMKYVLTVAEEKSFTKAAKKLYISQPSLSKSIKLLEEELKTELFTRKPLKLTYAGEIFVKQAQRIFKDIEDTRIQISDISTESKSHLIVGVPSHRCDYFIPKILKKLHKEFPNCLVTIEEYPTYLLKTMIESDKLDLFIGAEIPNSSNYKNVHIFDEELFLAYPKQWGADIKGDEVDIKQFKDRNFIMFSEFIYLREIVRHLYEKNNIDINFNIECHNVETIYSMIRNGLGVSLLPELYLKFLPKDNKVSYKRIKNFNYKRDLSVFYKKEKFLTKPARRFIEIFKEII